MARTQSLTFRGRYLAGELRRLRNETGMSLDQVAGQVDWNPSKVSRIETATTAVTPDDVERLLDLYGVGETRRAALVQLAKDADKRGWWVAYPDVITGAFIDMEDAAVEIDDWENALVPGLLQTSAYARRVFQVCRPDASDAQLEEHVRARMARKPLLERAQPPRLHAVLDEAVFRRMQGDQEVFDGQVRTLRETPPHVTIQVVPFAVTFHSAMDSSFTILKFGEELPDKAYVEGIGGDLYVESVAGLHRCNVEFKRVQDTALSPEDSAAWMDRLLKE